MVEQFLPTQHDQQQQYTLSLAMLLGALQTHKQNCMLWTHIADNALTSLQPFLSSVRLLQSEGRAGQSPKIPTMCQGELLVVEGNVTRSTIRESVQGQVLLEGHIALSVLFHDATLTWMIRPHTHHSFSHHLHDETIAGITGSLETETRWLRPAPPHLTKPLCREAVEELPHRQRQVLLLIYGKRDIDTICRMLHTTPQHLLPILDALAEQGWIT